MMSTVSEAHIDCVRTRSFFMKCSNKDLISDDSSAVMKHIGFSVLKFFYFIPEDEIEEK